ncbi:MAG: type II/IV secretion system protein [Opitutaceae bacterium]|nr:type II/IV secretion system protein [Opitutaceae bacterium]
MPTTTDDYLLEVAVAAGLVSRDRAREAGVDGSLDTATTPSAYRRLVTAGELNPDQVNAALAARFGMGTVELGRETIAAEVLALLTREQAAHYQLLPLRRHHSVLEVAIADPLDTDGVDALAHLLHVSVEPRLAPREEVLRAIDRYYGAAPVDDYASPEPVATAANREAGGAEENSTSDAPIVKLVHDLIAKAVAQRASDIHLEPLARQFRVRYRIDGMLINAAAPPKRLQAAVISRVKIMAGISIAEKRLPQDGRIQILLDGRPLDLRVSTIPASHGEGIVMRILDQQTLRIGLGELGFMPDDRAAFARLIAQPDGILLVTGPTGSGKTTTLYSCLHELNQPDRKIITVEDPVEYQLSGVNQVPVRAEVGMSFAAALRGMLRQAPNIVMVGEIRDLETAEIAIHASLTGHMVFSTLHTNDAPGAVGRLIDIGVKPFLVSSSLRGVLAQRLVRKVCESCSRPVVPTAQELAPLGITPMQAQDADFRRGAGCVQCHHTGYFGRMGIFELLIVDDGLRQLIHAGTSAARLRQHARGMGMRSLREDGARKVIAGLTTVEEVVSITLGDSD